MSDVGSGNSSGCFSTKSDLQSWDELIKSLNNVRNLFSFLLEFGEGLITTVSKHLEDLAKIEHFVIHYQKARRINDLREDLETVKDALLTVERQVKVLSCITENDEAKGSISEAVRKNDNTKLTKFLAKVQQQVCRVKEAYKEFSRVHKELKDSINDIWQQFAKHRSNAKYKKPQILYGGIFWTAACVVAALGLGVIGIAAYKGYVLLTTGQIILSAIGCGGSIGGGLLCGIMNYNAYSACNEIEESLEKIERELDDITAENEVLKVQGRKADIALKQCASKANELLLLYEEQDCDETIDMLYKITVNTV